MWQSAGRLATDLAFIFALSRSNSPFRVPRSIRNSLAQKRSRACAESGAECLATRRRSESKSRELIPFAIILRDELDDRATEMTVTDRNQPIEARLFDRADQAFGGVIAVHTNENE
jgi:hypothetical protein